MDGQRPEDQEQVERRQSVVLAVGDVVDLEVDDLPGAGYRWVARGLPDGLALVADEADPPAGSSSAAVGGPARRTLRLQGVTAGRYDVQLELVRPWEPDGTEPVAVRQVTVRVDPA